MKTWPFDPAAAENMARLVTITRGTEVIRFTDFATDITLQVSSGTNATFQAEPTMTSALQFQVDGMVSNADVRITARTGGPLDDSDAIIGRFDGYPITIEVCDTAELDAGLGEMFVGVVGGIVTDRQGVITINARGPLTKMRAEMTEHYGPMCRADLFDARCKVPIASFQQDCTVNVITGPQSFSVSGLAGTTTDDWYTLGTAIVQSGRFEGSTIPIRKWTEAGALIDSFIFCSYLIEAGTELLLLPGCAKTEDHCLNKYNNIVNRRAESFVPGRDLMMSQG